MDPKRQAKAMLGRLMFASGRHRAAFEDRAIVTCFHSITDEAESPIACTSAEFRDYCEFLKRYFDVIALDDLLARLEKGTDISGAAVITFDDGYLDNATLAAPELERLGLPATFFVATDFIESDHQAWWDTDCGITSRWMSWDDVRRLRDGGFAVGAHTQTHADLGAVEFDVACAEISGSMDRLESELGERPTLFAFPFGGQENMTPDVRKFIRSSGLRCCPSAYGGLVKAGTDAFELPRVPISPWYESPYQFGFEAARLRDRAFVPHQARSTPD